MSENTDTPNLSQGQIDIQTLLDAGVHFGHSTKRWNPKMKKYIWGARDGNYIIDLQQTVPLFEQAFQFAINVCSRGEKILFIGTKRQGAPIIEEHAVRSNQYYITQRWLGGTLTNFKTIKGSADRMKDIETMIDNGTITGLPKKEQHTLMREHGRLSKSLKGLSSMTKLPGALFVIDPNKEHIAISEALKLKIPIIAVTDTNCNPDQIDYVIPSNDDAIRTIRLFSERIADACLIGEKQNKEKASAQKEHQDDQQVINIASGGHGPRVEIAKGEHQMTPEASAEPS